MNSIGGGWICPFSGWGWPSLRAHTCTSSFLSKPFWKEEEQDEISEEEEFFLNFFFVCCWRRRKRLEKIEEEEDLFIKKEEGPARVELPPQQQTRILSSKFYFLNLNPFIFVCVKNI